MERSELEMAGTVSDRDGDLWHFDPASQAWNNTGVEMPDPTSLTTEELQRVWGPLTQE